MDGSQRDNTEDWLVPKGSVPLLSQLRARVDEALVLARASEEGLREVGEMALYAARQARRAAEAAEASARSAADAASTRVPGPASPVAAAPAEPAAAGDRPPRPRFDVRFRQFNERADRISARLQVLGGHPRDPATATFAPARRRGDG